MKTYGMLLTALIAHYEWCVDNLPKDKTKRVGYLYENTVRSGICMCSLYRFYVDLGNTLFIKVFTRNNSFLCETPYPYHYLKSKKALQTRIDRMKEMLPEWRDVEIGV